MRSDPALQNFSRGLPCLHYQLHLNQFHVDERCEFDVEIFYCDEEIRKQRETYMFSEEKFKDNNGLQDEHDVV